LEAAIFAIIVSTSVRVIAFPVAAVPVAVGVPAAAGVLPGAGVAPGAAGFAVGVADNPCLKIADTMLPNTLIVFSWCDISSREPQGARYLRKRCFLCFAYEDAALRCTKFNPHWNTLGPTAFRIFGENRQFL
jgi:hypothetical protein